MRTKINSINLFFNLLSKESQLHKDEIKFMKKQINLMNISPQGFFSSIERREKGGPVTKGKPYLVGEKGPEVFMPKFPIPDLPGLGGGGGGTDAITMKSKSKSFGKRLKDVGKVLTRPLHKVKTDPNEKFASEYVEADSSNNEFGSITSSMVNKPRVQTVVQPVIQTNTKQIPTPMPMGSNTQVIKTSKSKLPPSIAKMIN